MKAALSIGKPCRYWTTPSRWQKGTVLSIDKLTRRVTVQPSRKDLPPIEDLPPGQVKPPLVQRARQRNAVAGVLASLQQKEATGQGGDRAERRPPPGSYSDGCPVTLQPITPIAFLRQGGTSRPDPRPPRRIVSARYLKWIRKQPCCVPACSAPAQAHHYGPRGVGLLTDDPRTVPLCARCHLQYWHHDGTLPGYTTPEQARLFVLSQQVLFLQRYLTEHGAAADEIALLLTRAQVDALVGFFALSQRRRAA